MDREQPSVKSKSVSATKTAPKVVVVEGQVSTTKSEVVKMDKEAQTI
jgi:hypothetical protein